MAGSRTSTRSHFLTLLFCALLLKGLVPAGFMFAPGVPALVPCSVAAAPAAHHGGHHAPAKTHEAPCPFAALAAPVLPPEPPLIVHSEPPPAAAPAMPAILDAPQVAAAAPRPPARGPPALA